MRRYERALKRFLAWEKIRGVGEITLVAVEHHLHELYVRNGGVSVRQAAVVAIRSWCDYLLSHGLIETSPVSHLQVPRSYKKEIRPLSVAEVKRLIFGDGDRLPATWLELRDRALLGVIYFAGLRADEPGKLLLDDIEWAEDTKTFSVLVRNAKSSRQDERLHLDLAVSRLLGLYLTARREQQGAAKCRWLFLSRLGRPLTRFAVYQIVKTRLHECGVRPEGRRLSPHLLRHSIATHLFEAGWDARQVQAHLRHESVETTMIYAHTANRRRLPRLALTRSPLKEGKRRRVVSGAPVRELLAELAGLNSTKRGF